ncbi:MAG: hypothetical protein ABJF04_09390 [Reichenbachiella sp.]|uniref:hypothetical protein n=1 Tax=Reichenbachiella sp. TaxID=2184521 RepID=UPI0032658152
MNWTKNIGKNENGVQYWIVKPIPFDNDLLLIANWKEHLAEHNGIIHTFTDVADGAISNMMNGKRGEMWEYESISENLNWPDEIIIREL